MQMDWRRLTGSTTHRRKGETKHDTIDPFTVWENRKWIAGV
jgi:hypothetical protein